MCKVKRSYIPVALSRRPYKVYMDDLKAITKIIKKKTPKLPSYSDPSPKVEVHTDEEMEF